MSMRYSKSATVGVVGALLATMWASSKGPFYMTVGVMGYGVPIWLAAGGLMFLTSLASDAIHTYALPGISHDEKFNDLASSAISVAAPAVSSLAAVYAINPALLQGEMGTIALAGVGSEVIGSYIYTNFVSSYM